MFGAFQNQDTFFSFLSNELYVCVFFCPFKDALGNVYACICTFMSINKNKMQAK